MKDIKHKQLTRLLPKLPKYSFSFRGKQMEPVSLVILGSKRDIEDFFEKYGWYKADKITATSILKSLSTGLFNKSYKRGPISPAYIGKRAHQLGLEMPTRSDTFRRRHHMRLWRTKYKISGNDLWVGTASYDRGAGLEKGRPYPTHHISSILDGETKFVAASSYGAKPFYIKVSEPEKGIMGNGDLYVWDGNALVIDLGASHEA